jgi:hypothetical protein
VSGPTDHHLDIFNLDVMIASLTFRKCFGFFCVAIILLTPSIHPCPSLATDREHGWVQERGGHVVFNILQCSVFQGGPCLVQVVVMEDVIGEGARVPDCDWLQVAK